MSTSATGGNGGVNGLGSLMGISEYNYSGGTWRERFGEGLFTNRQKRIHAEREAQAVLDRIRFSRRYSAGLKTNIDRAVTLTGGQPADTSNVQTVAESHAPKSNLHLLAGVPVKV